MQLAVWTAFGLYELFDSIEQRLGARVDFDVAWLVYKAAIPTLLGFVLTCVIHSWVIRFGAKSDRRLVGGALIACVILSVPFSIGHFELKYILGFTEASHLLKPVDWLLHAPSRLVVLLTWTGAYLSVLFLGEATEQRARLRRLEAAAAEARAAVLRYQVNPHLLFNALNTVSAHVLNDDRKSADEAIQRLSDLLRHTLTQSDRVAVSLEEELRSLELYLAVERTRFGHALRSEVSVPTELKALEVPPLLLQPLVENAMKHGLAHSTEGGLIRVAAHEEGTVVTLTVVNEIPRRAGWETESTSLGVGLSNVRERLGQHYGPTATLEVRDQSPLRFEVALRLPRVMT